MTRLVDYFLQVYQKYCPRILRGKEELQTQNCSPLQFLLRHSDHTHKVYIHRFDVLRIQHQLDLSILVYFHGAPNLGRCHIEYSFEIEDNNF